MCMTLAAFLILSLIASPLFPAAEEDSQKDKKDKEESMFTEVVEVVGNVPVVKTIQSVSVFKNEDFENFNFESLKSVLTLTPGLLSLSSGAFGQDAATYIRGSKNTQVLYIIDGVKLRDSANIGGVNLSILSPSLMERIEVVRGPLSSIYGSDAMGGVVSINTLSREGADFVASLGSHGSYTGNFSGTAKLKDLTFGLSLNTQRYSDDVVNDVFKNTGISTRLNYKNERIDTGLRFFASITDSGIPFDLGVSTPERKYKQNYYVAALPFTFTINENTTVDLKLAYTNSKYEFNDPLDTWSPYYMNRFDNYEAELTYTGTFFEKLQVRAGVDYSDQKVISETNTGRTLDDEKMNYFSGYVSSSLNLDALQLSASVRYDKYKDVESNVSPQIGISYLIANKLKLRASYSHSFLAPLPTQMVNPWGVPNFDLAPEKGRSVEIGTEFYSEKVVLSAVYFNAKYEDMIDWVTVDWTTYAGQYRNVKNVDTYGVELSATFHPVYSLTLSGAYTYLHTEDKETGEPLVRKPKHTFSGFISYAHKRFVVSLNMVYVGKRPDLDYTAWPQDVESPAFNTYNFSLVVPVFKGLSVFGKLTNVFDKAYEEVKGYPAPGRRFELGLKYKIK